MGVVFENPIIMNVYNIGTMFLSDNTSVHQKINHIDLHKNFILGYVKDLTVKINMYF